MTLSRGIGRGGHNRAKIDLNRLRQGYIAKRPVLDIAKEYGVTVQTIYAYLKKLGITRTNSEAHLNQKAWNYKGGSIDSMGYRLRHVNGKQIREHRIIAAQNLNRPLRSGEVVHHINGDRADNRPENLEVHTSHAEHMREHMTSDEARKRGSKGLLKALENRKQKAALKAVGVDVETD